MTTCLTRKKRADPVSRRGCEAAIGPLVCARRAIGEPDQVALDHPTWACPVRIAVFLMTWIKPALISDHRRSFLDEWTPGRSASNEAA